MLKVMETEPFQFTTKASSYASTEQEQSDRNANQSIQFSPMGQRDEDKISQSRSTDRKPLAPQCAGGFCRL